MSIDESKIRKVSRACESSSKRAKSGLENNRGPFKRRTVENDL